MMFRSAGSLAVVLFLVGSCSPTQSGVRVTEAWARPAGLEENSAVYFQIDNHGPADRLVQVHTGISQDASLHRTIIGEDGVAQMSAQGQIEIPAGDRLAFEPGGYHVMLTNLTHELTLGRSISVTLLFERAGPVIIEVPVQNP